MSASKRITLKCEELKALARNQEFLRGNPRPKSEFYFQEHNLAIAVAISNWREDGETPQGWPDISIWSDTCANEMKSINGALYALSDYSEVATLLRRCSAELDEILEKTVGVSHSDILDHVSYHLKGLVRSSAATRAWPIFDRIALAYSVGGWPCGWIQRENRSDIIVYFQEK